MPNAVEITELLRRLNDGEPALASQLIEQVYDELKRIARQALNRNDLSALNPTALVHELYLRNVDALHLSARNRREFFAIAAHRMRLVAVDLARVRLAEKRGGGEQPITLSALAQHVQDSADRVDALALEQALVALEAMDPRKAKVVEMRYFAGAEMSEIAEFLGVSRMTVHRDWEVARSFLFSRLNA
jgi:RNA polymerase sigma factor (TIGR02999 family)